MEKKGEKRIVWNDRARVELKYKLNATAENLRDIALRKLVRIDQSDEMLDDEWFPSKGIY